MKQKGLQRYLNAQKGKYSHALYEIRLGKKVNHWMWFMFPQIKGLGYSQTAKYYEIQSIEEARAYLKEPTLSRRLRKMCEELLELPTNNPVLIFGEIDSRKLQSSMTLFCIASGQNKLFKDVLVKYFNGKYDKATIEILEEMIGG